MPGGPGPAGRRPRQSLILDEPTNHLDLWACDALEQALARFDGTVLFVSHDRYFVNRLADHLLVVEPGRFRVVEGNYETYLHLVQTGLAAGAAASKAQAPSGPSPAGRAPRRDRAASAGDEASRRKRRFPYRKLSDLEAEILDRETRLEQVHRLLAEPETLRDGDRVRQLKAEIAQQHQTLQTLYAHWEEAVELNW